MQPASDTAVRADRSAFATLMMPTRLAGWRPWPARGVIVALLALWALGLAAMVAPLPPPRTAASPDQGDAALYRAIAGRVTAGQSYYDAAVAEQRLRHYPLKPFVTVRPPLLAEILAVTGLGGGLVVLRLLALSAFAALAWRWHREGLPRRVLGLALVFAGVGLAAACRTDLVVWHEGWAAVLVALSLACRSPRWWGPALLIGIVAALIRELALPYLLVMAVAAAWERRRPEALAWAGAAALVLAALAMHAGMVAGHVTTADLSSPGWAGLKGWPLVLAMAETTSLLTPLSTTALAMPLALLGWVAWKGGFGLRGALLLGGYAAAFMVIGRTDNDYWGLIFAPLLPLGLAMAPAALRDLWRAARLPAVSPARRGAAASS